MAAAPVIRIPLMNLKPQIQPLKEEILQAWSQVLDNTAFCLGPEVEQFETRFAEFCSAQHAIGMNSGTSALHAALRALGVSSGDEVLIAPYTFVATAWAVSYCGATPVFADICPDTFCIDPSKLEAAITPKTKAIIPVHLYGQPCDLDPVLEIANKKGLPVIEDAAQAHGATYKGKPAGTHGSVGCFSFYPGKNLGACGEGGIAVTDDSELDKKMRQYRNHCEAQKYHSFDVGFNYRMEGLQAAVLKIKLKHLPKWTKRRQEIAAIYDKLLVDSKVKTPTVGPNRTHVYHLYVIRHSNRDGLMDYLASKGIGSGKHYPLAVHQQEAYAHLNISEGSLPEAEAAAREVLCLPMFPELTDEQVMETAIAVKSWNGE